VDASAGHRSDRHPGLRRAASPRHRDVPAPPRPTPRAIARQAERAALT